MKRFRHPIALLAALAMTGSATAATTISYTYQTIANSSVTSWITPAGSTSVAAFNFGSGGYAVWPAPGGLTWLRTAQPDGGANNTESQIGLFFYKPGQWAIRYDGYYAGDVSGILGEGQYGDSAMTLELNGFTVGQEYLVQFVVADTRGVAGGVEGRTITIDGTSPNIASQDSTAYTFAYGDGRFAVVTARFTPAAGDTNLAFKPLVNGGSAGVQLNAVHILTVPEPSAALLGGLGFLALLRRRRA